jgi:hypothetical protein
VAGFQEAREFPCADHAPLFGVGSGEDQTTAVRALAPNARELEQDADARGVVFGGLVRSELAVIVRDDGHAFRPFAFQARHHVLALNPLPAEPHRKSRAGHLIVQLPEFGAQVFRCPPSGRGAGNAVGEFFCHDAGVLERRGPHPAQAQINSPATAMHSPVVSR